ncbi:hypothetical protein STVIR_1700 [Streptomyces viridochromogenes Tue57]|uniref:Uncharacterized protein n=1 Tax=Streptomyces viridochromogenes Tue57 TaxID=1160705 RepID=L8PMN7_STRVR|nr:hypothetical protein STVIR_1700 [Streptomyces viridochromogenes Tue57]
MRRRLFISLAVIREPAFDGVDNSLVVIVPGGRRISDLGQRGTCHRGHRKARHQPAQSGSHAKPFLECHGPNMPPTTPPTCMDEKPYVTAPGFYSFR